MAGKFKYFVQEKKINHTGTGLRRLGRSGNWKAQASRSAVAGVLLYLQFIPHP
jgi:hypothetical protein